MKINRYEHINQDTYNNMKYPLYRYIINLDTIKEHVKKLSTYHLEKLQPNNIKNILGSQYNSLIPINNKYIVFVTDYYKEIDMVNITDYFSQSCRIKCSHMNNHSPLSYFKKNKQAIYDKLMKQYKKVSWHQLDIHMYMNIKQCTNFYTPIVVNVLHYFKPKRYLDFSAGWGDRLIGAIAYGMTDTEFHYTGVDPSECMEKKYKKIIKKLTDDSRYNVINLPFEDTKLESNSYDLVFTSPPFFDLEIYETDNMNQSIKRYSDITTWFQNFMAQCIDKSIDALEENGHLALYIADSMNDSYVKKTHEYIIKKKNIQYIGNIYWINKTSSRKLRIIRVYKKLNCGCRN